MKFKGLLCFAAAAVMSLCSYALPNTALRVSAENSQVLASQSTSKSSSFSLPMNELTLTPDGEYRIVPIADTEDITYTYKSKDSSIAKVSTRGLVVGVSCGETIIRVTGSDGTKKYVNVTVVEEDSVKFAESVYFSEEQCNVLTGSTYRPKAMITPKGADYSVSYYSDNEAVATVDNSGNITGVSVGLAKITIITDNGLSDSIIVQVSDEPAGEIYVNFEYDSVIIAPGEKAKPNVLANPSDNLKFHSENRDIAKVSNKGTILGVSEGYTEITVSNGYFTDSVMVYVTKASDDSVSTYENYTYDENGNVLPVKIEFEHFSDSVKIDSIISPSLRVYPKGAVQNFTFHSSDTSVAVVSKSGNVKGVGEGTCEISVTTDNGLTASFTLSVYKERFSGIDISKWNGDIDWAALAASEQVDFVMIRSSYGLSTEDIRLEQNVAGCESYNIPYGFYHYMYAKTVEEAIIEADFFLDTVRPYNPTYPLVLDIEESYYKEMSKSEVTDIVCAFMEKVEKAGYYAMIYSYASFFGDNLEYERVRVYDNWVACWGDFDRLSENFSYSYGMWQYSETGTIDGIPEDTDLDYSYKNYPELIARYGLTGYNNIDYDEAQTDEEDISYYTEVTEVRE